MDNKTHDTTRCYSPECPEEGHTTHDAARQVKGTDFRDIDWATGKPIEGQDIYTRRLQSARRDFQEQHDRLSREANEIHNRMNHLSLAIRQLNAELKRCGINKEDA